MNRSIALMGSLLAVCGAMLVPQSVHADFVGHPVTGAAIVTNGRFTNIYVYHPNFDTETWDQHLAAISDATIKPTEDFSRGRIDAFTANLMSGWPGYFDALMQYRTIDETGISPPQFLGSKVAPKFCVDAALKDVASNGVVQWGTLRSLANCHIDGQDPSPQVNLIISPDIKVAAPNFGPDTSPDMCGTGTNAYHSWGLNVPNFSVVPTNLKCNKTFAKFTEGLSHEIVEILANPAGFGYLNGSPSPDNYQHGELGDICEASTGARKNPSGSPDIAFTTYRGYSVARYWSDFDNNCVPRMEGPVNSDSTMWILGAGSPLVRLTGDTRDYYIPIVRTAPNLPITQLRLFIQTGGDDLRGDHGNAASATLHLRNGDQQTVNINADRRWDNNETHDVQLQFPRGALVSDITGLTLHKDYDGGVLDCCGDNWNVDKVALMVSYLQMPSVTSIEPPIGNCQGDTPVIIHGVSLDGGFVQAIPQNLNFASIPLSPDSVTPTAINVTVPRTLRVGVYELVVTTRLGNTIQPVLPFRTDLFQIGPAITSISPNSGPIPGGTAVTITGQCFDAPGINPNFVKVNFGKLEAGKGFNQCESSTRCVVYSPPVGDASLVDVIVNVDGATSAPSPAARFKYTGPVISRLTPNHGPKTGGTNIEIEGDGFPPYLGMGNNLPIVFGSTMTSALCSGSTVSATTSCSVETPAVSLAGPVQVVGTAFGQLSQQTPASLFTYDEFPQITKFQLPVAGSFGLQRGVFLNGNAPIGRAIVSIQSSDPVLVRPPDTVTVAAGQQWADVPVSIFPSPTAKAVTVTATYQGSSVSTSMQIDASPPLSIRVLGIVTKNAAASLTVTLNQVAPAAGAKIILLSADPVALPLPKSVVIPKGNYSVTIPLASSYGGKAMWVDITAKFNKLKAVSSVWLAGKDSNPPACKPKKCPKGFFWDAEQCGCLHGRPQ